LPVTIAASNSKWIAKLVTDRVKPFGVYVLPEEKVLEYTNNIPIEDFAGIGKSIYNRLYSLKVKTLGELRNRPHLLNSYGKMGKDLYNRICGTDNEKVVPNWDRKGIGISRNFKAISSRDEIYRRASILARYLSHTIVKLNLNPTTFYFKIRYEYGVKNSQSITENRLFNERFLIDLANNMIKKLDNHPGYKIHYIAISASNFTSIHNQKTLSLLDHEIDSKFAALNSKLLKIRDKYGIDAIKYGSEICK
jgi:DNA polymerase IV